MKHLHLVAFFLLTKSAIGQIEKTKNYKRFDERALHFGVLLGANVANFNVVPVMDAYEKYRIVSLQNKSQPGGQVGAVTTLKLFHPVVRLRMIPTLSFQERVIGYFYENPSSPTQKEIYAEERVNSTNFDLPLMLQFRTLRLNNFASYVLIGGQYTYDFQSQEKASQSFIDPFIKIRVNDFQGQVGGGLEFFLPYFKFGLEIKYSQSFSNSFIQDGTPSSKPIDQLFNKVWWFSLIFEG
ncbi:MAG: porin family protein [Fluviicola sp.]|nr:porin family protein [Fluviicola sp.]